MLHQLSGALRLDHRQFRQLLFRGGVQIDDPVFMVDLAGARELLLTGMVVLEFSRTAVLSAP